MRSKKLTLVLMLALGLGALGAGIGLGMGGNADDQRPNEAPPAHLFAPNRGTPDEAKNGGPPTNDRPRAKTVPPEKNATVPAPLKENTMGLGATVVPEKKEIMLGEPVFMAFKVANPTETPWQFAVGGDYRNRLGRPESFKVEVIGPDGKSVPQPDAGPSLGGIGGFARLPVNGEHSFELFLPHWATFEKPGEYKITVQRKVGLIAADAEEPFKAKPTVVTLSATATILVTEKDSKRLGALIEDLGKTMLDPKSVDSDRATRKLLEIRDPRVIPHFIAFSKLPHHAPRLVACKALGRFKTDEAFAALKALAATTGSDLRGTATRPDLEESSADSVRYAAVGALAGCGHPDSLPLVWKAIDDSYWGVRLAVLHKAAEVKSPEARAIIETLTKDPNETVRKEAIRYKELLAKEKK